MKIVYLAFLEIDRESGVLHKIRRQAEAWLSIGHEVKVFYVSRGIPAIDSAPYETFFTSNNTKRSSGYLMIYIWRFLALLRIRKLLGAKSIDCLYVRQVMWIPGITSFFSRFKTVIEVNTNDLTHISSKGYLSRKVLKLFRNYFFKNASGVVSVTKELENSFKKKMPFITLPNSINVPINLPNKIKRPRVVFFMSSPCQSWQGVDKIIALAEKLGDYRWIVAGWDRSHFGELPSNVEIVGYISKDQAINFMNSSGYAVAPLALHRKGMHSTSAIKTTEYLIHNLPVILAYEETGVSGDYLCSLPNCEDNISSETIKKIATFFENWNEKNIDRDEIFYAIDSTVIEKKRLDFIEGLA